jgi:ribonuclease R
MPLVEVYRALLKARHKRGALEFDAAEAEFDIDAAGRIQRVYLYERNEAHKLIEECMILANVAVAHELEKRGVGTLYRVHGKPEEKKLNVLLETLTALGTNPEDAATDAARLPTACQSRSVRSSSHWSYGQCSRPFTAAEHRALRPGAAALRALHRRSSYPDWSACTLRGLLEHRPAWRGSMADTAVAGAELTQLEKRADESDRYVSAWLKCVYLRDRIGQIFEGLITTVVEFGAFVQLTRWAWTPLHPTTCATTNTTEPGGRAWVGGELAPSRHGYARAHRHQRESHRGPHRPGAGRSGPGTGAPSPEVALQDAAARGPKARPGEVV